MSEKATWAVLFLLALGVMVCIVAVVSILFGGALERGCLPE